MSGYSHKKKNQKHPSNIQENITVAFPVWGLGSVIIFDVRTIDDCDAAKLSFCIS